jgi:hypothetical protein
MLQYAATYESVPSPKADNGTKNGEQTQFVSPRGHAFSRSLIGNYAHASLRFKHSAKVITFTWVTFESCAPCLVVLLNHCVLILSAPDGMQIETALPFRVDSIWPILLCNRTGGLVLQRAEARSANHFQAARKLSRFTLFAMTHPLNYVRPIGHVSCDDDDQWDTCPFKDSKEEVLLVTERVPPLIVTYSLSRQKHTIWLLLTRSSLAKDKLAPRRSNHSCSIDENEVSYLDTYVPGIGCTSRMPELLAQRINVLNRNHALLGSQNAALRIFCATRGNGDSILYLLLRKNNMLNSNCEAYQQIAC